VSRAVRVDDRGWGVEQRSSLYRLLAGGQGWMGGSLRWRIS
jgi:hypothetical protein